MKDFSFIIYSNRDSLNLRRKFSLFITKILEENFYFADKFQKDRLGKLTH